MPLLRTTVKWIIPAALVVGMTLAHLTHADVADEGNRVLRIAYCLAHEKEVLTRSCSSAALAQSCAAGRSKLSRMSVFVFSYLSGHTSDSDVGWAEMRGSKDMRECKAVFSDETKTREFIDCFSACNVSTHCVAGDFACISRCADTCRPAACNRLNSTCHGVEELLPY